MFGAGLQMVEGLWIECSESLPYLDAHVRIGKYVAFAACGRREWKRPESFPIIKMEKVKK